MFDRSQQPGGVECRDCRRHSSRVERGGLPECRGGGDRHIQLDDLGRPLRIRRSSTPSPPTNSIKANSTQFSDNVDAYTKLKEVGGQLDMMSGDALWVPATTSSTA